MNAFRTHVGLVVPVDRPNIDTDALLPKQYCKSISRVGFGPYLFDEWRYLDVGDLGQDNSKRALNPHFSLNQHRYQGATILLARENFGCGSSREHAVWALANFGFRVIIAPSFANILFSNAFKNGLLPVILDAALVNELFLEVDATDGYQLSVDLESQRVITPSGRALHFEIDDVRKHALMNGLDDIATTLQQVDQVDTYEKRRRDEAPWLFSGARVA